MKAILHAILLANVNICMHFFCLLLQNDASSGFGIVAMLVGMFCSVDHPLLHCNGWYSFVIVNSFSLYLFAGNGW